jgi:hypothetical protein
MFHDIEYLERYFRFLDTLNKTEFDLSGVETDDCEYR